MYVFLQVACAREMYKNFVYTNVTMNINRCNLMTFTTLYKLDSRCIKHFRGFS